MTIQIDSREKAKAIKLIIEYFEKNGIDYYISKLWAGDYMSLDNPRLIIDRKQNLSEVCSNVCQDHERFRAELVRAQERGIHLVILVEHGKGIESLEDVIFWENPRSKIRKKVDGQWVTHTTKAINGEKLYKILSTLERKYGVEFQFCDKEETGKRIVEILNNEC